MSTFESRAPSLAATLAEMLKHQGATLEHRLLQKGQAEILHSEHDNWNGGTDYYSFILKVPVDLFAKIGADQDRIEQALLAQLGQLNRMSTHEFFREVVIVPEVSLGSEEDPRTTEDDTSIWSTGSFRLFLSHHSSIKAPTHYLKVALLRYGIDSFVAHDDIQPTKDWQSVIEGALRTMDALVALVNDEFRQSKWCDQEVGVAIGRDRLVIPVRLGTDPYGFMGRYQGVQGKGLQPSDLGGKLVDILVKHPRSTRRFAEAVLYRFERVNQYRTARDLMDLLERFDSLPVGGLKAVEPALETNVDLRDAWGVPERFRKLIQRHSTN